MRIRLIPFCVMAGLVSVSPLYGAVTAQLIQKGVHLTSRIVPGGVHSEGSWERQVPFFLDVLLYDLI